MNIRSHVVTLIAGILLGIAGTIYLPDAVRPYMPESFAGKETVVKGIVLSKQRTAKALLLTANTSQGAVLATITKGIDEVDLLVGPGDTIDFTLKTYNPFIYNPKITKVVKSDQAPVPSPEASLSAMESKGTVTMKEAHPSQHNAAPSATSGSKQTKVDSKATGTRGKKGEQ
jgi:hypothetical protein